MRALCNGLESTDFGRDDTVVSLVETADGFDDGFGFVVAEAGVHG